jgi:hypothetical protein
MKRRSLLTAASAATVMTLGGVGYAVHRRGRNPYYRGPESDHFDGVRFFAPGQVADKALADILRWKAERGGTAWPKAYPSPFPADRPPERVTGLRIVLIGHASYLVQVAGRNILIDPVFATRASPTRFAGPKRVNPPGIAMADLPPIDAVLITHNHYDHLDGPSLARIWQAHQPLVVAPLGNDTILRGYDDTMHVETADWGGSVDLGDGVAVHLTPAYHWSARGLNDRRMALGRPLPCRRYRLRRRRDLPGLARPLRAAAAGDPADRRLRAALVHAGAAHEPGRRGRRPRPARSDPGARPPLGHLPAHRRGHRAAGRGVGRGDGPGRAAARALPRAAAGAGVERLTADEPPASVTVETPSRSSVRRSAPSRSPSGHRR